MGLRPAKCYREIKGQAYTRYSRRRPSKSYVKTKPHLHVHRFELGKRLPKFTKRLYLIAKIDRRERSNAIEAARQAIIKYLEKKAGKDNFFLKLLVYPHEILREHKLMTGAGADRMSKGMKNAFGKPIGLAARIYEGTRVFMIEIDDKYLKYAEESLRRASHKLSGKYYISIENIKKEENK